MIKAYKLGLDRMTLHALEECYIAFDVETTGLDRYFDRIVELGAVRYEKGVAVASFNTLVNPGRFIPYEATAVNHITNAMLATAPREQEAYAELTAFLGDALEGKTLFCAHNAKFDMDFLGNALDRLGYSAELNYVDTLGLSRKLIPGLMDYRQDTVAHSMGIYNRQAHRATTDAEVCGQILWRLIQIRKKEMETVPGELPEMNQEEKAFCAMIRQIIVSHGGADTWLTYKKSASTLQAVCHHPFMSIKCTRKGRYVVLPAETAECLCLPTGACSAGEDKEKNLRVYLEHPRDLELLSDYICTAFTASLEELQKYIGTVEGGKMRVLAAMDKQLHITEDEMESWLRVL